MTLAHAVARPMLSTRWFVGTSAMSIVDLHAKIH